MVFSSLYDLDAGAPKRAKIQRPDYASINAQIRGHAGRYQRGRNDIGPIVDDGRYVRVRYVFLPRNRRNRPFYVTNAPQFSVYTMHTWDLSLKYCHANVNA